MSSLEHTLHHLPQRDQCLPYRLAMMWDTPRCSCTAACNPMSSPPWNHSRNFKSWLFLYCYQKTDNTLLRCNLGARTIYQRQQPKGQYFWTQAFYCLSFLLTILSPSLSLRPWNWKISSRNASVVSALEIWITLFSEKHLLLWTVTWTLLHF